MIQSDFIAVGSRLILYAGEEESIIIPDWVTIIGEKAFYHNTLLREVILPQNMVIENKAGFRKKWLKNTKIGFCNKTLISSLRWRCVGD